MTTNTSLTDNPRNVSKGEKDDFGIEVFEEGLTEFISNSLTPITIALQGEWGSGKTSLMNGLKQNLSDCDNSKFHSIWLNTWEFALMKDAQSTLMDIIAGLIQETSKIAKLDETTTNKLLGKLWSGIKDTSMVVAKKALDNAVDGAGTVIDTFSNKGKSSISDVRNDLEDIIEKCITKDKKKGIIFFIDDLDRIDPPVAVQLLELLKNIFTLKNCVFILAIDYDVVVKGLEPKFGKLSEKNEREFRSFFDKIIQVPFSMPVSSYQIDDFLKNSLKSINYLSDENLENRELIAYFSEISNLSVGKNPRALKRLMNSLSLIKCINSAKHKTQENNQLNEELELLINFALVSIQIAYPPVYRLLTMHPGFDKWDENIALQMNLDVLAEQSIEKLKQSKEFDEEWEQVLFRLCENDFYLKKRALNISRLLNLIKDYIIEKNEKEKTLKDVIKQIISLSSITSIDAIQKPEIDYHRGSFLKILREKLIDQLKNNLPDIADDINDGGKRVGTYAHIHFSRKEESSFVELHSNPFEGGIKLQLWSPMSIFYDSEIKEDRLKVEYKDIEKDFKEFISRHKEFNIDEFDTNFIANFTLSNAEEFFTEQNVKKISLVIEEVYQFITRLGKIENKISELDNQ